MKKIIMLIFFFFISTSVGLANQGMGHGNGHGFGKPTHFQGVGGKPPGLQNKTMPYGLEKQGKTPYGWGQGEKRGWSKEKVWHRQKMWRNKGQKFENRWHNKKWETKTD